MLIVFSANVSIFVLTYYFLWLAWCTVAGENDCLYLIVVYAYNVLKICVPP